MQPRQAGRVPAGLREAAGRTGLVPDAAIAGPQEYRIAGSHPHTLATLGLLEIVGKHTLPRCQPRHITGPRNVQQDTTRDDPVRRRRDRRPRRSRRGVDRSISSGTATSHAHDTLLPWRTTRAAASRTSSVMWFKVPSSSSSPHRPQFDSVLKYPSTSSCVGTGRPAVIPASTPPPHAVP